MSFIGKPVYKIWATNALRFGNIMAEKQKDGWTYVKVKWKDDEAYEMDVKRVIQYRNIKHDPEREWHRVDNIKFFNPAKMMSTLRKLAPFNSGSSLELKL